MPELGQNKDSGDASSVIQSTCSGFGNSLHGDTLSSENASSSICTDDLMMNPTGGKSVIRKSEYSLPGASLTFKDLTFSLPASRGGKSKVVLEPCSGHFDAGQMVAIMGPSGCGKTTLLDMLAAKKTTTYDGMVLVNGRPRDRLFRRIAAYVGQEDMMPAHWTVRDAIKFNATLKRQPNRAHQSVDGWIDVLLISFDLQAVANSYIGGAEARGISGGQRRRVTLARGVAAHASLLFCDEPTSGLSATDAERCVRTLRIVAKRLGITCLVVIHQPRREVAMLFDSLVLLTSSPGRMAYSGPFVGAQAFWYNCGCEVPPNVNPTDYYLDLLTPGSSLDRSDEIVARFRAEIRPQLDLHVASMMQVQGQSVAAMLSVGGRPLLNGPFAVPFRTQLGALLRRKLRLAVRNPAALGLPLAVPVIQGVIVGYMFDGIGEKELLKQIMFAFCLLTMLCLAGTMSLIVLITERTLMKHEASEALYSEVAASLASFLVDVPLALTGALLNIVIMASFARLDWGVLQTVVAWALLLFFVYDSLFAFIGAVARDTRQAQVIATPFISIFMLFNGFIVSKVDSPAPLHWIFSISPNSYAMQSIVVQMVNNSPSIQGKMMLKQFGYTDSEDEKGLAVMLSMIVIFRIGQQLGLRYLNNLQK